MENRNPAGGCLFALIIIAVVVGLTIWRAENSTQLWTALGVLAIAVILIAVGSYFYSRRQELFGCFTAAWGLLIIGIVGYVIITSNFETANDYINRVARIFSTPRCSTSKTETGSSRRANRSPSICRASE